MRNARRVRVGADPFETPLAPTALSDHRAPSAFRAQVHLPRLLSLRSGESGRSPGWHLRLSRGCHIPIDILRRTKHAFSKICDTKNRKHVE